MALLKQKRTCKLNDVTDKTRGIIHLMITSLCARNCRYCCNKYYSLDDIPHVTEEELKGAHTLCLTGGEPFMFTNPSAFALYFKQFYQNIKKVYVYSNAYELSLYLLKGGELEGIDGINVSIKSNTDKKAFELVKNYPAITRMPNNRLYVFGNLMPDDPKNFKVFNRVWQKEFAPAEDSFFRLV